MKITIIVLNYCTGTVSIYNDIDTTLEEVDDHVDFVEFWISEHTKHNLSDCSWMSKEGDIEFIYNDHE